MSLNEIQLGGKMLADLYGSVLISEPSVAGKPAKQVTEEIQGGQDNIRSLGKNKKNYCFIVSYDHETFIPDDKMDVLIKIMQACRLSMEDIALINISNTDRTIDQIREQFAPSKMVLLGVGPDKIRLPIQFPAYKPQSYAGCTYLYSDALDVMDNSITGRKVKSNLWVALKEMFDL